MRDEIRVTGRLTGEGVECQALRSDRDEQLYTLTGNLGTFQDGDRVVVEGTIAEMSHCQQGTTISVSSIVRFDSPEKPSARGAMDP